MKTINDIPCGHLKPLPRLYNPFEDRKLRKQIETANTRMTALSMLEMDITDQFREIQ